MPGIYKVSAEDSWGDPVVKLKFGVVEIKAGQTLKKICDFDSPPPQKQAPSRPPLNSNESSAKPQPQAAGSSKQIAIESTSHAQEAESPTGVTINPRDIKAQAADAQAEAMEKIKATLDKIQGLQAEPKK